MFEICDDELSPAGFDVSLVPTRCGFYHLSRAVNRGQMPAFETLANKRRGNAMPASYLKHPIIGSRSNKGM